MKCSYVLLFSAAVLTPGVESFLSVPSISGHKQTASSRSIGNIRNNSIVIRSNSKSSDDMVNAMEEEARKICPLIPPPEDITATFEAAMGWFWGPQRDFDREEGVVETVVGYSGSTSRNSDDPASQNPTYRNVQDYAESIRVTFNKDKWTYEQMLQFFFDVHTPADPRWAGTQYRSAIFYHTEEQKQLVEHACKQLGALGKFVSVEEASDFYRAEEYHQKYVEKQVANVYY